LFSWYQALWIISAVLTLFIGPLPTLSAALLNLCLYYCVISSKQLQYKANATYTKQKGKKFQCGILKRIPSIIFPFDVGQETGDKVLYRRYIHTMDGGYPVII